VGFADRSAFEKTLQNAAPGHYGVRTLVHEIVQSGLFLNK